MKSCVSAVTLSAFHFTFFRFGKSDSFFNSATHRQPRTFAEAKQAHRPRTRHTSDDISGLALEKKKDRKASIGSSSAITIPVMGKSMSGEDLVSSVGCFPVRGELLFLSWGNPCWGRILCRLWGVSLSEVSYYSCHGEIHVRGGSCVVCGVFPCQGWVTIPVMGKSMSGEDLVSSVGCFPVRGELLFLSSGYPCCILGLLLVCVQSNKEWWKVCAGKFLLVSQISQHMEWIDKLHILFEKNIFYVDAMLIISFLGKSRRVVFQSKIWWIMLIFFRAAKQRVSRCIWYGGSVDLSPTCG